MSKDPTIPQINAEIRKVKKDMKGNEDVLNGLTFLCPGAAPNFIEQVKTSIENQKEIIKCLESIKEKLL